MLRFRTAPKKTTKRSYITDSSEFLYVHIHDVSQTWLQDEDEDWPATLKQAIARVLKIIHSEREVLGCA